MDAICITLLASVDILHGDICMQVYCMGLFLLLVSIETQLTLENCCRHFLFFFLYYYYFLFVSDFFCCYCCCFFSFLRCNKLVYSAFPCISIRQIFNYFRKTDLVAVTIGYLRKVSVTVSEHFLSNDHNASDMLLIPLELIKSNRDSVRTQSARGIPHRERSNS